MDDLIKGMDDIVEGWTDRLVVMTWEVLWMMMDYATPESLFNSFGVDLAPTNRAQEVDLHEICGIFGASPHLVRHPSPPTKCSNTSLFHSYLNNSAAVELPNANLQSIVEGGGLRFGDGDGDGGGSAAHCIGRLRDANLNLQLWGFLASEPANPIFGRSHQFRVTWNPMVSYALHSIEHLC